MKTSAAALLHGSGTALAWPLRPSAALLLARMASSEDAGVSRRSGEIARGLRDVA